MRIKKSIVRIFFICFLSIIIAGSLARAESEKDFTPEIGQPGKDVVWVPTPQPLVDKMLDMAKVTPRDYLIDLGSGDGRIVIAAAKRGVRAHGIEYNPDMVALSERNAAKEGVSDKASFEEADIFQSDLSQATVITMFLLPNLNIKLRPIILGLKPGTRIVSNTFDMGEWEADETATATEGCESFCTAYFWVVPANVGGTWKLRKEELMIEQNFQMFTGALKSGNLSLPLEGKIAGDRIRFNAGGKIYVGRVNGDSMDGEFIGGRGGKWKASRIQQERQQ
jgi:precorrin-6B methylase 2